MTTDSTSTLPKTLDIIQRGMDERLHIGAQVYASIDGEPVADFAVGETHRGDTLTTETIMPWMSAVKPVGAVAIGQLWELGKLKLDDPVAKFVPEFGVHGKEAITLRHLLTHTSGLRGLEVEWSDLTWSEMIERIAQSELYPDWEPGKKAGYEAITGWAVLGEVLQRITGQEYHEYVRENIFEPLGMDDSWIAIPETLLASYEPLINLLPRTGGGVVQEATWQREALVRQLPAGSGRGPIRELGRFYEMLLFGGELDGARILTPQTVEALTTRHRTGLFDHTFGHVYDWGLGFVMEAQTDQKRGLPYQYGRYSSPRAFGHGGRQSSIGFADPEHNLVVAWVLNGTPGEVEHFRRNHAINSGIYKDLGLAA